MKINWKIRFSRKNIIFIVQVVTSVIIPVFTYFGLKASDITTWAVLYDTFMNAVKNPYVLGMMALSLFNAVTDPTTKGINDSESALGYIEPK